MLTWLKRIFRLGFHMNTSVWLHLCSQERRWWICFAGVGPFSVLIAKKNPEVRVYAVDINPDAVELLKVNARVNRVENRVFPILGDARQITATKLKGSADRVIMNLPETAIEFVDAACQAIKPQGGIIHFYAFVRQPDSIEEP